MKAGQSFLEKRPMQCMEIRGGNQAVEESLEAPGLKSDSEKMSSLAQEPQTDQGTC